MLQNYLFYVDDIFTKIVNNIRMIRKEAIKFDWKAGVHLVTAPIYLWVFVSRFTALSFDYCGDFI